LAVLFSELSNIYLGECVWRVDTRRTRNSKPTSALSLKSCHLPENLPYI